MGRAEHGFTRCPGGRVSAWRVYLAATALLLAGCGGLARPPSVVSPAPEPEASCHPQPDFSRDQYIVGYGSLMNEASKRRTAPNAGLGFPVRVRGFERRWIARGGDIGFSATYLGVVPKPGGRLNAAMYRVEDDAEVLATDARERGYCRRLLRRDQIEWLGPGAPPGGEIWIYEIRPERRHPPSRRWPIVQSYVDIFLSGCLDLEARYQIEGFAAECVRTTRGWSVHWVNDRIHPRRAFLYQPLAGRIDRLLYQEVPEPFSAIRIE